MSKILLIGVFLFLMLPIEIVPLVFKMVVIFLAPVPIGILWAKETLKKDMKKLTKGRRI